MSLTIHQGVSLADRTTLKLGGTALAEVVVRDRDGLRELPDALARLGGTPVVWGWGSNLLPKDGQLDVVLIRPCFEQQPEVVAEDAKTARVRCGAWVRLPKLVSWAARRGYRGLARLAGIPGTIGGAVAMNAGSYGGEFCSRLSAVDIWSPLQRVQTLPKGDFDYAYRRFNPGLDAPWCVLSAELELDRDDRDAVVKTVRETLLQKKSTQPVHAATAGCVFKNPEGMSAGRLLDACGFKGKRLGGMGFSDLHANFLVNYGNGTAAQALELMDEAARVVAEEYGTRLEPEVKIVG